METSSWKTDAQLLNHVIEHANVQLVQFAVLIFLTFPCTE